MNGSECLLENNISILVFSVGGVRFGVESSQIVSIDPDRTNAGFSIYSLDSILGLAEGDDNSNPVALEFWQRDNKRSLVLVDCVEDMFVIPQSDIRLLPKVIAERVQQTGIWGVVQRDDNIIILLELSVVLDSFVSNHE